MLPRIQHSPLSGWRPVPQITMQSLFIQTHSKCDLHLLHDCLQASCYLYVSKIWITCSRNLKTVENDYQCFLCKIVLIHRRMKWQTSTDKPMQVSVLGIYYQVDKGKDARMSIAGIWCQFVSDVAFPKELSKFDSCLILWLLTWR